MKLIMENWNKFLKENEAPDPKWLDHIMQVTMDYTGANSALTPEDIGSITLSVLADEGAEIISAYQDRLDTSLAELFGQDIEAVTADIIQGASEVAAEDDWEGAGQDPDTTGNWRGSVPRRDPLREDTLEERGLGLGEPRDTPPGDGFGDDDDGYPPERPAPKKKKAQEEDSSSTPRPVEGKVSGHRSEVTYSKEKRGKSKKPEKKAYNKADRTQTKLDLKKAK